MIISKATFSKMGSRRNKATAKYPSAHDNTMY